MLNFLFFIAGIALGYYLKDRMGRKFTPKEEKELKEIRKEAIEALSERTEDRKEKILEFIKHETAYREELKACRPGDYETGITSAEIEKLVGVSNDTARKYLNELEKEGEITQVGTRGKGVHYVLNRPNLPKI
ncbi:MAG: hypothetical protein JW740_00795 [Candidatus Zambryskibacteria bacterium]|nr:hypothetical protein [Candidatus Zambryskibacteria bacterium]